VSLVCSHWASVPLRVCPYTELLNLAQVRVCSVTSTARSDADYDTQTLGLIPPMYYQLNLNQQCQPKHTRLRNVYMMMHTENPSQNTLKLAQ